MDKNVTLIKVINYNSCSKFMIDDNGTQKEVVSPARYLGIVVDSDEKIIPIGTFKDFHKDLLEFFAKTVIIGDKSNPKFKVPKKADDKVKK